MGFAIFFFSFWLIEKNVFIKSSWKEKILNIFLLKYFFQSLESMWEKSRYNKGNYLLFSSLFIFLYLSNFLGLFRYILPWTANYLNVFFVALSFWLRFLILGGLKNTVKNISHLAPKGSPIYLGWFIVLVETLRILIRPITLRVRLATNISTGHLLLSLAARLGGLSGMGGSFILFFLELLVVFVQAYVFCVLLILYFRENV